MAAYSLGNVVTSLRNLMPWSTVPVAGEPLTGVINGLNKMFYIARPPAAGGIIVKDSAGNSLTVASFDTTTGLVTLSSAPVAPCFATYTHSAFSDTVLSGYAREGFYHMESLLSRGYVLVEDSGQVYVSADATQVVDPPVNGSVFSALPTQTGFLNACAWLMFLISRQTETAMNAITLREERVGGLMMDRSRQSQAWEALVAQAQERVHSLAAAAAAEAGLSYVLFEGGVDQGARSDYYTYDLNWWRRSRQGLASNAP